MHSSDQHLSVRPPSSTKLVILLSAAFAVITAGAAILDFSKKEYVTGFVQPQGGDIRITAPAAGVVRYSVAVGDTVAKGRPLVFLEAQQLLASGKTLKESQSQVLTEKQDSLQSELYATQAALGARAVALSAQARAAQATVDQARAEVASRRQFLVLEERKVERQRTLRTQGFISAPAVEDAEAMLLERRAQLQAAERTIADAEASLASVRAEQASLAAQSTSQRQQLEREVINLRGDRTAQQHNAEVGVTAPVDAEVSARATAEGDSAQAGQLLLRLSPKGAPQEAVLLLPATASGRVQPGQAVSLQLAAYPYQTYGLVEAKILHVDKSPLVAQEARALQGANAPQDTPVVAATAQILTVPAGMGPLKNGMQFQAAVEIERKSFLAWMLAPLLKNFQ